MDPNELESLRHTLRIEDPISDLQNEKNDQNEVHDNNRDEVMSTVSRLTRSSQRSLGRSSMKSSRTYVS